MSKESEIEFAAADWFRRLLGRWPVLLALTIAGSMAGAGIWRVLPRRYAAAATVVVNHHAEKVLPKGNEYEVASYLNREAMRLEAIAASDVVWSDVEQRLTDLGWQQAGVSEQVLRGLVELPHPYEGSWEFVAYGVDPAAAAMLADAWSQAFLSEVTLQTNRSQQRVALDALTQLEAEAVSSRSAECASLTGLAAELSDYQKTLASGTASASLVLPATLTDLAKRAGVAASALPGLGTSASSQELTAYGQELATAIGGRLAACKAAESRLRTQWETDLSKTEALERTSDGVSPYLDVALTQAARPVGSLFPPPAQYLLVGSLIGLVLGGMVALIWPVEARRSLDAEGRRG